MTTGIINGTDVGLYIGSSKIANSKSCSISITHSPRRSHNKDTGGYEVGRPGAISWSINQDGEFAFDAAYGAEDLIEAILDRTKLTIKMSTEDSGDFRLTGDIYLDSFEWNAGSEEDATFSISGSNASALTKETITT